jgi:hypothetical protein
MELRRNFYHQTQPATVYLNMSKYMAYFNFTLVQVTFCTPEKLCIQQAKKVQTTQTRKYETSSPSLAIFTNSLTDIRTCIKDESRHFHRAHCLVFLPIMCEDSSLKTKSNGFVLAVEGFKFMYPPSLFQSNDQNFIPNLKLETFLYTEGGHTECCSN